MVQLAPQWGLGEAALLGTIFVDFLNSKNNVLHKNKQGA